VVYAGQGERGRSLGDIFIFNFKDEKKEWKRGVSIKPPESRHQHTLVGDETNKNSSSRYLFGGINTPNNTFFNDLWELDISGAIYDTGNAEIPGIKFVQLQTGGQKPVARKGHCSFFYMKRLFIYGGQCEEINYDTMKYIHYIDLSSSDRNWNCIENKSAYISPRSLFSCSWYNDSTLLVGLSYQAFRWC
jgi:hypothetical protein